MMPSAPENLESAQIDKSFAHMLCTQLEAACVS